MSNIVGILADLTPNALVLLDELGAGTDPTEGAALAIAILQYLRARDIRTVVTTHYAELKLYALSTDRVENASCEFSVETLCPTYRLLIGIPGKSNAFAIAARLGLPEAIIAQAKDVLSHEDVRFEDMITDLEASKKTVLLEQERAAMYRREAEVLRQEAEKQKDKLDASREKMMRQARDEAAALVRRARDEADATLKQMRKQLETPSHRELESARQAMRDRLGSLESDILPAGEKPERTPPANLRKGDRVYVHSLGQHGTVSDGPDANGIVNIQAGIMKLKVNIADLSLDDDTPKKQAIRTSSGGPRMGKSLHISSEIDLRGQRPEEALSLSEKYLDDAFLASLSSVTLIHGKGTGALRTAIHTMLKRHPHVTAYRLGKFGEGESGVTVVSLK